MLPELTGEDDADTGRWSGCRGAGCGARAMQPIRLHCQIPRTVFLPLLAALLALRVSTGAGRRGCLLRGLTCVGACAVWACKLSVDTLPGSKI